MRKRSPGNGRPEYLQFRPYRAIVSTVHDGERRESLGRAFFIGAVVALLMVGLPVGLVLVLVPSVWMLVTGPRGTGFGAALLTTLTFVVAIGGGLFRVARR